MAVPTDLYRPSLALLTDFYEITMAAAAWKSGIAGEEAAFTLSFRRNPFQGGFTIAAGLESVIEHLARYRFEASDLEYLAAQQDGRGAPLFERGFLDHLAGLRLELDLDAVPEGTAVFPWEPVLRVKGPVIPCLLLETPLLTLVNFQTLIATKAARVCLAAGGAPVLEFQSSRSEKLACSELSALYPGVEALARSFASWSWRTCSASIPDAAMYRPRSISNSLPTGR